MVPETPIALEHIENTTQTQGTVAMPITSTRTDAGIYSYNMYNALDQDTDQDQKCCAGSLRQSGSVSLKGLGATPPGAIANKQKCIDPQVRA